MLTDPIESSKDCSWLTERWATAHHLNNEYHWFSLAAHLHCCAMAMWDMNSVQRFEYLTLASLADTHAMNINKGEV